jgi:hypothetical protein
MRAKKQTLGPKATCIFKELRQERISPTLTEGRK